MSASWRGNNKLAWVTRGALAEQVSSLFNLALQSSVVFDDVAFQRGLSESKPLLDCLEAQFDDCHFVVALGYRHLKLKDDLLQALIALGRHLPTWVSPQAIVHPSAQIGPGSIIWPGAIVGPNCELGAGTLLHSGAVLPHDVKVGRCGYVSPGVKFSGDIRVGDRTFIGTGSTLTNGILIGPDVRVGVGSVVQSSVPESSSVIGYPARKVSHLELV